MKEELFVKELSDAIELEAQELCQIHCDIDRAKPENDRQYYKFLKKGMEKIAMKAVEIAIREN